MLISAVDDERKHDVLQNLATIDGLTQLNNSDTIKKKLDIEILRSNREQKPLSILFLDMDYFKQVNDTHGHNA